MPIELKNTTSIPTNAPDWRIDPEDKLKDEYSLHWSRYIYNQYLKGSTGLRTRTTRTFRENRDYFNCRQDTNKYKSTFSIGKTKEIVMTTDYDVSTENTNRESSYEGWANINFEPVSAMYKLANMIHGTYDDADWELVANCTDQQSGAEKEKFKWGLIVEREYGDWMRGRQALAGIPTQEPMFVPKDDVELEFYMSSYGFKLPFEISLEKAVQHSIEDVGTWKDIKYKLINDYIANNVCAVRIKPNSDGSISTYYVDPDPEKFIIQNSDYSDFRDAEYAGHIEYWSIYKVRDVLLDLGKDKDEVEKICTLAVRRFSGELGNPIYNAEWGIGYVSNSVTSRSGYQFDMFKIPVLHLQWIDTDVFPFKKTTNRFGRTLTIPLKKGQTVRETENTKQSSTSFRRKHQCSWIVDTEIVFNTGLGYPADTGLDYKIFASPTKSMIEVIKPFLDGLCIAWYKLQNAVATARSNILAFQYQALQNIQIGGGVMDPLDILKMAAETGYLPYMSIDERGRFNVAGGMPIQELPGGFGTLAKEAIELINQYGSLIQEYTGINPIALGSTPAPRTGKAVTEMAVGSSSTLTKPIIDACLVVKNRIANAIAPIILSYIQNDKRSSDYYTDVIGKDSVNIIKQASKYPIKYGIKLESQPTDEQVQMIRQYLQQGLALGRDGVSGLRVPEAMYIEQLIANGTNLKQIWMFTSMLVDKAEIKKQQMAMQAQQMEAEKNERLTTLQGQIQQQQTQENHLMQLELSDRQTENQLKIVYANKNLDWLAQQIQQYISADEAEKQMILSQLQNGQGQYTPQSDTSGQPAGNEQYASGQPGDESNAGDNSGSE